MRASLRFQSGYIRFACPPRRSFASTSNSPKPSDTRGALEGVVVLDLSRVLAGPWASQALGDLGATVIKVEHPNRGDDTRHWGPPFLKDDQGIDTKESSYFLSTNRSKRSIAVDITNSAGQNVIHDLVAKSDIMLENFKVGSLAKYHLDYESISNISPKVIYCSITGYGQTGPRQKQPGYDFMLQASSGLMSITGEPNNPYKVGVAVADLFTGMYATTAILAALHARTQTGRGQHVDVSLHDSQLAMLSYRAQDYLDSRNIPQSLGNSHPNIVPYNAFPTADGTITIGVGNDSQFISLCELLGINDANLRARFATNPLRVKHREELSALLATLFQTQPTSYWLDKLNHLQSIPYAPVNNIKAALEDPQVAARNMVIDMPHPLVSTRQTQFIGSPIKLSDTPVKYTLPPPLLGEHTSYVLSTILNYPDSKIEELYKSGVVA